MMSDFSLWTRGEVPKPINFLEPDFWTVFEAADWPIGCRSGLLAA
jgi:hypothetical protein